MYRNTAHQNQVYPQDSGLDQHSDSVKKSEPGQSEHNEKVVEESKKEQTQTNSGEFETKMAISQKFQGEQESALSKAVIHLQEKHLGVTVKNMQTYFMMNNTKISDRL